MRLKPTIGIIIAVMLVIAACRGSGPQINRSAAQSWPLYGTSVDSYSVLPGNESVSIRSDNVPETGVFILLASPDDGTYTLADGNKNDNILFIQVPTDDGVEIGAVPIDSGKDCGLSVSFRKTTDAPLRMASLFEDPYRVDEIIVVPSSEDEFVTLNWVEKNIGDYDFNGEVNSADLVPLSQNFGQTGFRNSTAANTTALFYIDGDENNEINLADIVPIARNFHNTISGYYISKNGELILEEGGENPRFYSRDAGNDYIINSAPVFFQVSIQGSFEDQYSVLAVDASGSEQSESIVFDGVELQSRLELQQELLESEPSLFDLSGNGITIPEQMEQNETSYFCVMRIIEPGDIVNGIGDPPDLLNPLYWNTVPQSADEGSREAGEGYRFDKLRRPELAGDAPIPYQLEILVAPTVDLLTGEPRSYSGSNVPNSFYYRFAVPVFIQHGFRTLQADLKLDLVPAEDGPGYEVIIYNNQYQTGEQFDNSVIRIALSEDPETGDCVSSVSRVFDPLEDYRYIAGDFIYSPQFSDDNCDGISDQLQRRLISLADTDYYSHIPFPLKLLGKPDVFDTESGQMTLLDVYKTLSNGLDVFYAGQQQMQLSEMTRLTWIIRDDDGEQEVEVSPHLLQGLGDNASTRLEVSLHDGPQLDSHGLLPLFWVDSQTITLDLTSAN